MRYRGPHATWSAFEIAYEAAPPQPEITSPSTCEAAPPPCGGTLTLGDMARLLRAHEADE